MQLEAAASRLLLVGCLYLILCTVLVRLPIAVPETYHASWEGLDESSGHLSHGGKPVRQHATYVLGGEVLMNNRLLLAQLL
jgi:hypothetical protein